MEEFKGNPTALKQEEREKKVAEPVTTSVKVEKKSSGTKFFAQDLKTTARNVGNDIVLPGFKSLLSNIFKNAIDLLFFGKTSRSSNGGYVPYSSASTPRTVTFGTEYRPQTYQQPVRNTIYELDNVLFQDRGEADEVLYRMGGLIEKYGMVSVADFYDLIGQRSNFTDNKYGWKDLNNAMVSRVGLDGYRIVFPPIIAIE